MGNSFGCTAGERPEKADDKPMKNGAEKEEPLLSDNDDLAILLEIEDIPFTGAADDSLQGASEVIFWEHVSLAFRTSIMCVLIALPIIIPKWHQYLGGMNGGAAWLGMVPGGVALMTVFTIYQNLGLTVQLAWQGGAGTAIACLWAHVMSALMPMGAFGDHYNPYILNTSHCLLMVFTYWLNISKNVRMFIVSYQVFFAMSLQTPSIDPGMNESWAIRWDAPTTTTLGTSAIGLACAVLVMLFPKPIRSKDHARRGAMVAAKSLCMMMDELFTYYKRSEASVSIAKLETDAARLQMTVAGLQANIDGAWWETFDIGKQGKIRSHLTRHVTVLQTLVDNMFAMQICIAREDFAASHITCMEQINAKVAALIEASSNLLVKATEAASDGSIDADEREGLEACNATLTTALSDLAKAFNTTRRKMFPERVINTDLQAESFFVYCLSIHGRSVLDYSKLVLGEDPVIIPLSKQMLIAFKDCFDWKMMKKSLHKSSFAVRGSLEILIAYYMGLYLFQFNAAAACTVSLLLSEFSGSAIIKNLGRLQAVVLSAVVPHIITGMIGSTCDPFVTISKGFAVFAWEMLTLYTYYSSATYGYIGCLTAAFALGTLIYPCAHLTGSEAATAEDDYSFASYTKILQTTIAVMIMLVVDAFLSDGRASDKATDHLLKGLMHIDVWFQAAFMAREDNSAIKDDFTSREGIMEDKLFAKAIASVKDQDRQRGTIMNFLTAAADLGAEADKEARYHRAAWPGAFFNTVVREGQVLRANLNMVEQVLKGANSDSLYTDVFAKIRASKPWTDVKNDVVKTLGETIFMVQKVLKNETAAPLPEVTEKATALAGAESLEDMPDLINVINASGLKYPAESTLLTSLEEDVICRINVILMLMDASVGNVADIVKECLKQV